jgi:hypothetical protein
VNTPGIVERWQLLRPEMVAAVVAAIAVGGWAGATIKSSGMMYTNLFVAGCLLLVLAVAGLGALAAAHTQRTSTARVLAVFAGVAAITAGVAYAIAPPYRSASADRLHRGSIALHIDQLAAIDQRTEAECRTGPNDPAVFMVFMQGLKVDGRDVMVLLNLSPGATSVQVEKITIVTMPAVAGSTDHFASSGTGLDATLVGPDGLSGSLRFSAAPVPDPARSTAPELDRLTGTFEWVCDPTPSG